MSGWLNSYSRGFHRLLPSPMAIALTLTLVALVSALSVSEPIKVVKAWSDGLWNPGLMRFGFQAMYMLVLGHVLALSKLVRKALDGVANFAVKQPANAAAYVTPLAADPAFVGISTFEPIDAVPMCTDFGIPTSYD